MRRLAEERAAFENRVDDQRTSRALQVAKNLTNALLAEAQRWLIGQLARYTAERIAHATSEAAKTATTAAGTAARTSLNLSEVGSALLNAGADIVGAVAKGIKAVAGVPFPGNVLLGAATVAGITALFAGAKSAMGFAGGGYTGDGDRLAPAGVVHRGEFVITKAQVGGDPAPFYALASLLNHGWTMRDVLGVAGLQGYATGGYVSPVSVVATSSGRAASYDDSRLVAATERNTRELQALRRQVAEQRPAPVVVTPADARRVADQARRQDRRERQIPGRLVRIETRG